MTPTAAPTVTTAALFTQLEAWREAGLLRALDLALVRWLHSCAPQAPPSLLLAAALLARLEGLGHSALPLAELTQQPLPLLGWAPQVALALQGLMADWPAGSAARAQAWAGLDILELDPEPDQGHSPLVLSGELLYLRRYWRYESEVAAQVLARVEQAAGFGTLDLPAARLWLTHLFARAPAGPGAAAPAFDWQQAACALALRGRLTLITGGPGTGKTRTAARLLVLLQALHALQPGAQPLRVALAAPTGKAAARLRQSIQHGLQDLQAQGGLPQPLGPWAAQMAPAQTLHRLLGRQNGTRQFKHNATNPLPLDVLLVDEASMVHLEQMAQLLQALPAHARLVLLGDPDQLASVEAGAVLGDLCAGGGGYTAATAAWLEQLTGHAPPPVEIGPGTALAQQTVVLRHSHRFGGPIGELARAVHGGDGAAALALLRAGHGAPGAVGDLDDLGAPGSRSGSVAQAPNGGVSLTSTPQANALLPLAVNGRSGALGGYSAYLKSLAQRPTDGAAFGAWALSLLRQFERFRVLCAVREGPWGVAGLNRSIQDALGNAGLLAPRGPWYEGRPVMVTRNDTSLGLSNGDVGLVLRPPRAGGAGQAAAPALRCYFLEGEALRSVAVSRLADVETAFAMTVHKAQGSEFEHVLLVLPEQDHPGLTRELVYTGITRARSALTLACKNPSLLVLAAQRLTQRASGLRAMLAPLDALNPLFVSPPPKLAKSER